MSFAIDDHPVLIPTSQGPVGGIVTEPVGAPVGALVLLQGGGRAGRSGFDSEWTRLARRLAALGVVVLRFDYWREGDSSMITAERYREGRGPWGGGDRDLALLREVAPWFAERVEGLDLLVVGSCYGGRLAIELAGGLPRVRGTLLVVPYLRHPEQRLPWRDRLERVKRGETDHGVDERSDAALLDPVAVDAYRNSLAHARSWLLMGELDPGEVYVLERLIGGCGRGLEFQVVPGVALYPGNSPDIQELVSDQVSARVAEMLGIVAATDQPARAASAPLE
jgi:dienelactone hydrolase